MKIPNWNWRVSELGCMGLVFTCRQQKFCAPWLKLCEMSGLPGKKALLISLQNTIGRSPIFSSIDATPFKTGTEFSVGLLTIRFFCENVSRTSSSAVLLLQPSLEDLCNRREKGSSAEKGIECQNCQICPVTSSHPMTCFLCGWWGFLRGWW